MSNRRNQKISTHQLPSHATHRKNKSDTRANRIQRVLRLALTRRIKSSVKLFASCRESVVIVIAEFRSGKRGLKFMLQKRGEVCCGFGDYGLFLEQFLHHGLDGEDSFASCDPFGCHYRAKCETVAAFCAVGD